MQHHSSDVSPLFGRPNSETDYAVRTVSVTSNRGSVRLRFQHCPRKLLIIKRLHNHIPKVTDGTLTALRSPASARDDSAG